jgi:hypothetical protein
VAEASYKPAQSNSIGDTTLPKHLYHGTTATRLGSILRQGLRPRGKSRPGNWQTYPSRKDMVYLTTAYAPYFALNAVEDEGAALIVEVDTDHLDPARCFPDEDFVAQCLAYQEKRPLVAVHDGVQADMDSYQHLYPLSVERLGNLAYRGTIPADAITRYVSLTPESQPDLCMMSMDPCISPLNYQFCGPKYRSIIAWLFGDRGDFEVWGAGPVSAMQSVWKNRAGISVITKGGSL